MKPIYAASQAMLERAKRVIPGGHHLSGRALVDAHRSPMYFERADGCRLVDVDGRTYVDYLMAYGAVILGYANDEVNHAASLQAAAGGLVSLNHRLHPEFVEALLDRFRFAEMGMFMKTGSEATTAALRIARRATGRRKVVRCGYHGWHDWCVPTETFVPEALDAQVLDLDVSDADALSRIFEAHPSAIAAVIVAPEMIHPPSRTRLLSLMATTRAHGAVFILDEVKTAFRIAPGSIHQRLGLEPDVITVSKALGNGWPVAAVLGTRAVMEHAAGLHVSATYHGDTIGIAAAMATMRIIDREHVLDHVHRMGERLIAGLALRARRHGVPIEAYGEPLPPMPFMRFVHPVKAVNDAMSETFYSEVLANGVLLHPRHLWFISQAHREEDIDHTLEICEAAFAVVARRHGASAA